MKKVGIENCVTELASKTRTCGFDRQLRTLFMYWNRSDVDNMKRLIGSGLGISDEGQKEMNRIICFSNI